MFGRSAVPEPPSIRLSASRPAGITGVVCCSRFAALTLVYAWAWAIFTVPAVTGGPDEAPPAGNLAGTYRIASWRSMAAQHLHHFFYLHPDGLFLLAAQWPGHESSRFAGHWTVAGDVLRLVGQGRVETNQGSWQTPFRREFTVVQGNDGLLRLEPRLEKNRYGLLGWPDAFVYLGRSPAPNLPETRFPAEEKAIGDLIRELLDRN